MKAEKKYNHMFDIAFSVESNIKDPDRLHPTQLVMALLSRIVDLMENCEMQEACGHCDSYENKAKFHLGDTRK